jgi:hypothetical protein
MMGSGSDPNRQLTIPFPPFDSNQSPHSTLPAPSDRRRRRANTITGDSPADIPLSESDRSLAALIHSINAQNRTSPSPSPPTRPPSRLSFRSPPGAPRPRLSFLVPASSTNRSEDPNSSSEEETTPTQESFSTGALRHTSSSRNFRGTLRRNTSSANLRREPLLITRGPDDLDLTPVPLTIGSHILEDIIEEPRRPAPSPPRSTTPTASTEQSPATNISSNF